MRKVLLLILAVVTLPGVALAQFTAHCPGCVLGLWDDVNLASNSGTITPGVPKDIYLGIRFSESYTGVSGVEFSVRGLEAGTSGLLVIGTEPLTPASVTLGTPPAPADTTNGTGGMSIAWADCVTTGGDEALVKITILAFAAVPANKLLLIHHKFPPTNPTMPYPLFTACNPPTFTLVSAHGGCYALNPSGPDPCPTGVEPNTWSGVKELFR